MHISYRVEKEFNGRASKEVFQMTCEDLREALNVDRGRLLMLVAANPLSVIKAEADEDGATGSFEFVLETKVDEILDSIREEQEELLFYERLLLAMEYGEDELMFNKDYPNEKLPEGFDVAEGDR